MSKYFRTGILIAGTMAAGLAITVSTLILPYQHKLTACETMRQYSGSGYPLAIFYESSPVESPNTLNYADEACVSADNLPDDDKILVDKLVINTAFWTLLSGGLLLVYFKAKGRKT